MLQNKLFPPFRHNFAETNTVGIFMSTFNRERLIIFRSGRSHKFRFIFLAAHSSHTYTRRCCGSIHELGNGCGLATPCGISLATPYTTTQAISFKVRNNYYYSVLPLWRQPLCRRDGVKRHVLSTRCYTGKIFNVNYSRLLRNY